MLTNLIQNAIEKASGNLSGNLFLDAYYNKKIEHRVIECLAYIKSNEISDITHLSEVVFDLAFISYIWAMPNARAEYKRKLGIGSTMTLVKSTYKYLISNENWMDCMHNEVISVYKLVPKVITNSLLLFIAAGEYVDVIDATNAQKLKNYFVKNNIDEYRSMSFKSHSLGNYSLIGLLISPSTTINYFRNKYRGYERMGYLTSDMLSTALEDHPV